MAVYSTYRVKNRFMAALSPTLVKAENDMLTRKSKVFGFDVIKGNNGSIHLYSGLLNLYMFMWLADVVRDKVYGCHARFSVEDHALGLLQEDLAHRFGLEFTIVSNVY